MFLKYLHGMKKKLLLLILICSSISGYSQTRFRSGVFLHHSSGSDIWGPNESETSVPVEIDRYNIKNGLTGESLVSLNESWWPAVHQNNDWYRWHWIFEGVDDNDKDLPNILMNNKIVIIKSCYPSSSIEGLGKAEDTLSYETKSVFNYKWHWRHIIKVMQAHPENFFVIWTNAPLNPIYTNINEALLSKSFCKWAKDTLATGKDKEFGKFPSNVYVFDYFSKITDINGYLLEQYAKPNDSHPNAAATTLVAPQLVNEIFNAAIAYENLITGINENQTGSLIIYPNPANDKFVIQLSKLLEDSELSIINSTGQEVFNRSIVSLITPIDISNLRKGIYLIRISNNKMEEVRQLIKY